MKKTFNFGKIKYTNKSKRVNLVEISVELRNKVGPLYCPRGYCPLG